MATKSPDTVPEKPAEVEQHVPVGTDGDENPVQSEPTIDQPGLSDGQRSSGGQSEPSADRPSDTAGPNERIPERTDPHGPSDGKHSSDVDSDLDLIRSQEGEDLAPTYTTLLTKYQLVALWSTHPWVSPHHALSPCSPRSFRHEGEDYTSLRHYVVDQVVGKFSAELKPLGVKVLLKTELEIEFAHAKMIGALKNGSIPSSLYDEWASGDLQMHIGQILRAFAKTDPDYAKELLATNDSLLAWVDPGDSVLGIGMSAQALASWLSENEYDAEHLRVWADHPAIRPDEFGANVIGNELMALRRAIAHDKVTFGLEAAPTQTAAQRLAAEKAKFNPPETDQTDQQVQAVGEAATSKETAAGKPGQPGDEEEREEDLVLEPREDACNGVLNVFGTEHPLSETNILHPIYIKNHVFWSVLHYVYYNIMVRGAKRASFTKDFIRLWRKSILGAEDLRTLQKTYRDLMQHFRKKAGLSDADFADDWPQLLEEGIRSRVEQSDLMFQELVRTDGYLLVSANPHDSNRGIGVSWQVLTSQLQTTPGSNGRMVRGWFDFPASSPIRLGRNLVGKILMNLRAEFIAQMEQKRVEEEEQAEFEKKNVIEESNLKDNETADYAKDVMKNVPLNGILPFFKEAPLSDFHVSAFKLESIEYQSIVEFLWSTTLKLFNVQMPLPIPDDSYKFHTAARRALKSALLNGSVRPYVYEAWEERSLLPLYLKALRAKFSQNPALHSYLIGTKRAYLAFASKNNSRAGVGMAPKEYTDWAHAEGLAEEELIGFFTDDAQPSDVGENVYGIALMVIREEIRHHWGRPSGLDTVQVGKPAAIMDTAQLERARLEAAMIDLSVRDSDGPSNQKRTVPELSLDRDLKKIVIKHPEPTEESPMLIDKSRKKIMVRRKPSPPPGSVEHQKVPPSEDQSVPPGSVSADQTKPPPFVIDVEGEEEEGEIEEMETDKNVSATPQDAEESSHEKQNDDSESLVVADADIIDTFTSPEISEDEDEVNLTQVDNNRNFEPDVISLDGPQTSAAAGGMSTMSTPLTASRAESPSNPEAEPDIVILPQETSVRQNLSTLERLKALKFKTRRRDRARRTSQKEKVTSPRKAGFGSVSVGITTGEVALLTTDDLRRMTHAEIRNAILLLLRRKTELDVVSKEQQKDILHFQKRLDYEVDNLKESSET